MQPNTSDEKNINSMNRVFIGGLPPRTTKKEILNYLSKFGQILSIDLKRDNRTGLTKGYGFVQCGDYQTKEFLLKKEHFFGDRRIDIRPALPRKSDTKTKLAVYQNKICIPKLDRELFRGPEDEQKLRKIFERYGSIRDCYITQCRRREAESIGYVEFDKPGPARHVLAALGGVIRLKNGEELHCTQYLPRKQKMMMRKLEEAQKQEKISDDVEFSANEKNVSKKIVREAKKLNKVRCSASHVNDEQRSTGNSFASLRDPKSTSPDFPFPQNSRINFSGGDFALEKKNKLLSIATGPFYDNYCTNRENGLGPVEQFVIHHLKKPEKRQNHLMILKKSKIILLDSPNLRFNLGSF